MSPGIKIAKNDSIIPFEEPESESDTSDDNDDYLDKLDEDSGAGDAASEAEDEDENATLGNAGWADSMSKILKANKPKGKKSLVLSKAKKHTLKTESKPAVSFEVIGEDGESKPDTETITPKVEDNEEPKAKKKRENHPDLRTKPNILDREREKLLSKIATRGVVQLFNTVRNQQKEIEKQIEEAGPLERKKEKVIKSLDKNKFLDILMGQSKSENINKTLGIKNEVKKEEKPKWNVFREDFMMGAKMKDWDKKEDNEEDEPEIDDTDSD